MFDTGVEMAQKLPKVDTRIALRAKQKDGALCIVEPI
jgi:hypothetical protein